MPDRWTDHQVLALAPDPSSAAAARRLAVPGPWTETGATGAAVWGSCRGSGRTPYQVAVDLAGPASTCTCPSRKFPCKHALGLLLLWSTGAVPAAAAAPGRVAAWLSAREQRASRPAAGDGAGGAPGGGGGPGDPDAARRRAEQRERRMLDGVAELEQWLRDQVRSGLAGTDRAGYALFEGPAARMVDAQVPAVAAVLRRLAAVAVSGEGWPARLLEEYALLHLLARSAPAALARPGTPWAATVRAHLGVNVPKEQVLAGPGERDRWRVLALRDDVEERLTARRVWLRGSTGALALVLGFAAPGQPLDTSLTPGTDVDAVVHRYPGTGQLRALVGDRFGVARATGGVPGVGLDRALAQRAAALAADPWLVAWPVVLAGMVPVVDGDGWWLVDPASGALPLVGGDQDWALLAASGGGPVTVLAELLPAGVRAVAVLPAAPVAEPARAPEPAVAR